MYSVFDKIYKFRFEPQDLVQKKKIWNILCSDFFQKFISEDDVAIDMGAGFCEFINAIEVRKKIAIDQLTISQHANEDVCIVSTIDDIENNTSDIIFMSKVHEK